MWRAFVYDSQAPDRAMQASLEFVPFDGKFKDNVIIQIMNGPIDFQTFSNMPIPEDCSEPQSHSRNSATTASVSRTSRHLILKFFRNTTSADSRNQRRILLAAAESIFR